jgi:hypothetical protein
VDEDDSPIRQDDGPTADAVSVVVMAIAKVAHPASVVVTKAADAGPVMGEPLRLQPADFFVAGPPLLASVAAADGLNRGSERHRKQGDGQDKQTNNRTHNAPFHLWIEI